MREEVLTKEKFSDIMNHLSESQDLLTGFHPFRLKSSSPFGDIERVMVANFNRQYVSTYGRDNLRELSILVYGVSDLPYRQWKPKKLITFNEAKIVLSVIQWLGTNCGIAFLEDCGFVLNTNSIILPSVPDKTKETKCSYCGHIK